MSTQTPFILKQLIKFHLFTSLAISLASSWGVTDLLLLKMDFDLARFGIIKGNMFPVPVVMCVFSAVWLVMSCRSPKEGRKNGTLEKQNR